jgi:hypothetical protein
MRASLLAVAVRLMTLLAVTGCVDGYPTHDLPGFDPRQMSQSERVSGMNSIGQGQRGSTRFLYAFDTACGLSIERHGTVTTKHSVELAQATIEMHLARDAEPYRVVASRSSGAPVDVYEGTNRIHAMQMDSTVKLLQRDCIAANATR